MLLNPENSYDRIDNIVYENGKPILRFFQTFINIKGLSRETIEYMNRYLEANPNLYTTKKNEQDNKNVL